MTRINTNTAAFTAQNALAKSNKMLSKSLERLSTGFRINKASDAPAGLVISERLRAQIAGLRQAVDNSERAQNMVATAEAALIEVNSLLLSVQDLVIEAANDGALSQEEIVANQAQIDDAINTIDRIANTTNFGGLDLLNGVAGYTVSALNSGTASTGIIELQIDGAALRNGNSTMSVLVEVTADAQLARLSTGAAGTGSASIQLLVQGNLGSEVLTIAGSSSRVQIAAAVDAVSDATGVDARVSGAVLIFESAQRGSDEFVIIQDLTNPNPTQQFMNGQDFGTDVQGTINGIQAAGNGLQLSIDSTTLDIDLAYSSTFYANNAGATSVASSVFYINGGGLQFQLGGGTRLQEQAFLGINRIGTDNLGGNGSGGFLRDLKTGGSFSLTNDPETAHKIIGAAIDDITNLRARLGAFQSNTLESNINSLNVAIENIAASESRIRDTDFAAETAEFTRTQILVQAGTAVLAQANLIPQTVLSLLA